jgi:hypothetical protein
MVDITIVFMGIISWFINQLITGGTHPVVNLPWGNDVRGWIYRINGYWGFHRLKSSWQVKIHRSPDENFKLGGGFKHERFIFHFIYGMSSFPLTFTPSFFTMVKLHHQPVIINHHEPSLNHH